jgi:hypothetical protein
VFTIGAARVTGLLSVDAGALSARLEAPGEPVVTLLTPNSPFDLNAVSVDEADLVLIGRLDLARLIR